MKSFLPLLTLLLIGSSSVCAQTVATDFTPQLVADAIPGAAGGGAENITPVSTRIYYEVGENLWLFNEVTSEANAVDLGDLTYRYIVGQAGEYLFIAATNGEATADLYRHDGKKLLKVANLVPDRATGAANGDDFYFMGDDGSIRHVWRIDTDLNLAQISSFQVDAEIMNLTEVNGNIYFTGDVGTGRMLYQISGSGLTEIKGSYNSVPEEDSFYIAYYRDAIFFTATTAAKGTELWSKHKNSSTAYLAADIYPGAESSNPRELHIMYEKRSESSSYLIFSADDGTLEGKRQLFTYDRNNDVAVTSLYADDAYYNPENIVVKDFMAFFTCELEGASTKRLVQCLHDFRFKFYSEFYFGTLVPKRYVAAKDTLYLQYETPTEYGGEYDNSQLYIYAYGGPSPGFVQLNESQPETVSNVTLNQDEVLYFVGDDGTHGPELYRLKGNNRAPQAVGNDLTMIGYIYHSTSRHKINEVLYDPDPFDALTYGTPASSDESVVSVALDGDELVYTINSLGSATITLSATDEFGLEGSVSFTFTVKYPEIFSEGSLNETNTNEGILEGSMQFSLAGDTFTVRGSELTEGVHYHMAEYPEGLTPNLTVNAEGTEATLTFSGVAASHGAEENLDNIAVTFTTDALVNHFESITSTTEKGITFNYYPTPVLLFPFKDLTRYRNDGPVDYQLSYFIEEPSRQTTTYTITSSDESVVQVGVADGTMTISPADAGIAQITIETTTTDGAPETFTLDVTVKAPELVYGENTQLLHEAGTY